jgi:hypothetical protein
MDKVELDPEIIEATKRLFRNHRPTVDGVPEDLSNPNSPKIFLAYDLGMAAVDSLLNSGVPLQIKKVQQLENAAKQGIPNADKIIARRERKADELNS